jgi:hypothetical protein
MRVVTRSAWKRSGLSFLWWVVVWLCVAGAPWNGGQSLKIRKGWFLLWYALICAGSMARSCRAKDHAWDLGVYARGARWVEVLKPLLCGAFELVRSAGAARATGEATAR